MKFVVRDVVGGTNLVESAWLGAKTAAQTLTADLSGVDLIELVVYPDPDNGGGWQHCDSAGTIKSIVVHSATYDYSSSSDKTCPLAIDGGSVDIGDGSAIGSDGLELGVLSGGYLRYTVSEIPETGVPDFPAGFTFAADAERVFTAMLSSG